MMAVLILDENCEQEISLEPKHVYRETVGGPDAGA